MNAISTTRKQKSRPQAAGVKPKMETASGTKQKQKPAPRWQKHSVAIAAGLLVLVVAACYANALGNGFVFDDDAIVLGNPTLRNVANIPHLLTASYRPLRDVTHAMDFWLWGRRAFGFHLTNILIHGANVLLVFFLIRKMTGEVLLGALAALIFAIHPMQPDSVTYISGRRDVLFSLFYLSSFFCYLHYHEKRSKILFLLFIAFWVLSLMSKEMAVSLPLFIFAWSFCEAWGKADGSWWKQTLKAAVAALKKDRWLYLLLAAAVAAYGWYMVFVRGGSTLANARNFIYWGGSFYTNLLTAICVHAWYLKQLIFPTPVIQYLGAFEVATTILDLRVVLSILAVGSTITAGFLLLRRDRLMSFAIFSYFILLLPVSQIIPHHELLADHYLYLPLMSFGLFVALVAKKISTRSELHKKIAYGAAAAAVVVFAVMTVMRNPDWKDELTVWETNYREAPNSIRAAGNLASLCSESNPNKAIALFRKCIELDPSYGNAYLGLASLMQSKEGAREVEGLIEKAMALPEPQISTPAQQYYRSYRWQMLTALALTKIHQDERAEAEQLLKQAIAMAPGEPQPYKILAEMYASDPEKQIEVLKTQIAATPRSLQALDNLTYQLILQKRYDEALPYLERIIAIDPNDFNANHRLGQIYLNNGDCQKARAYLTVARSAAVNAEQRKAIESSYAGLEQKCGRR